MTPDPAQEIGAALKRALRDAVDRQLAEAINGHLTGATSNYVAQYTNAEDGAADGEAQDGTPLLAHMRWLKERLTPCFTCHPDDEARLRAFLAAVPGADGIAVRTSSAMRRGLVLYKPTQSPRLDLRHGDPPEQRPRLYRLPAIEE